MEKLITPEPGMIIWTCVTFVLLLVILRGVAWKPILGVIEARERAIRESMEASRRAREQAEAALAENRRILSDARRAAGELIQRGEQDAAKVKSGILEQARREQEELTRRGREAIERETRQAVKEIRTVAAELALLAAEKVVESRMDDDASRRLVDRFLTDLEAADPRRATS